MAAALERVVPVAGWAGRVALRLAVVAIASAAVLGYELLHDGWDGREAFVAAVLFAPGAVLVAFRFACQEVVELPQRLRALPRGAVDNIAEARRLLRKDSAGPLGRAWRALLLTHSTRELLTPYAPLVALFSPFFLTLTGLAVAATLVLGLVALVALLA